MIFRKREGSRILKRKCQITVWRTSFGRGNGLVARQTTQRMNEQDYIVYVKYKARTTCQMIRKLLEFF